MLNLSICIPTFQRKKFLEKCIESITVDVKKNNIDEDAIELLIFDNNSEDGTDLLCKKIQKEYKFVKYHKSKTNIGSDGNIAKCYDSAKGSFVWLIGDDDQIIPGTIIFILDIIKKLNSNVGIIFLNSFSYQDKEIKVPKVSTNYKILPKEDFIKKYHVKLTFLSSLILRNHKKFKSSSFVGSSLVQLHQCLKTINLFDKCAVLNGYNVLAKRENSGEIDLSYNVQRNKVGVAKIFIKGFLNELRNETNSEFDFKKIKKRFLLSYIIYEYAFVSNSLLKKDELRILDEYFNDLFIYKAIVRKLLLNISNRINRMILLIICFYSRVLDGEFFKILNFLNNNLSSFKIFKKTETPYIFVDGCVFKDISYKNSEIWKEGSIGDGNGLERGGMEWNKDKGEISIPLDGIYCINWHPMLTNSDNNRGEQRWHIIKNNNDYPLATHHWNGSGGSSISSSTITYVHLLKNDTIKVKAHETFCPRIYSGAACTYLNIFYVSKA